MDHLIEYFAQHPVIAGVRDQESLRRACKKDVIALFVLSGDIFLLTTYRELAEEYEKLIFLHIDLIEGIGRDRKGVEYLAKKDLCDGIVSTKSNLIRAARDCGLLAVQRLFLLDSAALKTGEELLRRNHPDAVEILPGIAAPHFIRGIKKDPPCPVIAGGLIEEKSQVETLCAAGVMAVSTSREDLW